MDIRKQLKNPMTSNFVSLVLLQGINYLLPLISVPFLIRMLGDAQWGLAMFGYTSIQYFIIFTDFGFNLSGTRFISTNRQDKDKINTYLNSAMLGRLFLGAISFLILLIVIAFIPKFKEDPRMYLLYFGMVIGNIMCPVWFFQGMEKMKYMTIFNVTAKLLSLLPFFIFIRRPDQYLYVPIFYSFGYIIAGLTCLYLIYRKMDMKWFLPSLSDIKFALKDSSTYFLSSASVSLFTTSNTFILGLVCGDIAVAYYYAAERLYKAYNQLLYPFTAVLFPHIAKSRDTAFFKKVFKKVTTVNVFTVSLALFLSPFLIRIFTPGPESLNVFRILITGCYLTIPSMLLGYPFLAAMGHPTYTNMTVILSSFFHVAGLLILFIFGLLSIHTVATMVVITETLLFAFRVWGVRKFNLFKSSI